MATWFDNLIAPSGMYAGAGMTPQQIEAAQLQARLAFSTGLLGNVGSGRHFGAGLAQGLSGAQSAYQGAMDTAYRHTLLQKEQERRKVEEEREAKRFEREQKQATIEERTRRGDIASRVAAGMAAAPDKNAYWNLVSRDPEVQAMLQEGGITAPMATTTPEQYAQFGQQLGAFGQVAGPRLTPRDLELRSVIDPSTGQQVLVPESTAIGMQPGYAPVAPTGQLTSMDLPGGMKQNVIFDPRARTTTPVGEPFKESSQTKPTEGNLAASGFFARMTNAEQQLGNYSPALRDFVAFGQMLSGNAVTAAAANNVMSPESQAYYQAASDWVRAKLRKESGASIPAKEMMDEIRTYFPVPGDSEKVIAQKTKSRQVATQAMEQSAGPAVAQPPNFSNMPAEIYPADSPQAIEAEMRRRGLIK